MDLVLDEKIDKELKVLLVSMANLSKGKVLLDQNKENILNEYFIDLITPVIINNYSLNFKKSRNLLHIILYNYNYATMIDDYVYEELDFCQMVETLNVNELLKQVTEDNNLSYYLIQQYFYLIFNPSLQEMLENNDGVYENINWLNNWYLTFSNEYELITTKLKMLLFDMRDYCDLTESSLKDEILLNFLYEDKDYFHIINAYFNSYQEFKSYKFLLNQMLYLDAYYYLQSCKSTKELDLIEKYQLTYLEKKLKDGHISNLPNGKFTTLKLLDYFYLVNANKDLFKQDNDEKLIEMQQLIKKKASKVLLLEYC